MFAPPGAVLLPNGAGPGAPGQPPMMGVQPILPVPPVAAVPPGLHALYQACRMVYPDQPNPLQVAAVLKYWLGGPDPLDYISMFANPGDPDKNIPPHWHYISFGFSDLHGDGRVHQKQQIIGPETLSGFGFELTFRLRREADESSPPTWPAAVMQLLAKYVFHSENILCPGDHISWHCSLDNSDSRIQHMIMTQDPQLGTVMTPFGSVTFVQIVGVCAEELQAAQQWNGSGLIDLMRSVAGGGGPWLITDMRRGESIFELDPEVKLAVDDGISAEGSNLSGVTAKCSWVDQLPPSSSSESTSQESFDSESLTESGKHQPSSRHQLNNHSDGGSSGDRMLTAHGQEDEDDQSRQALSPTAMSRNSRHSSMSIERPPTKNAMVAAENNNQEGLVDVEVQPMELIQTKYLDRVHITLNAEAGVLLPLALRGRLKHGRHFSFKTVNNDLAVTLLTEKVRGDQVHATAEQPFALHGQWLQVLIEEQYLEELLDRVSDLQSTTPDQIIATRSYCWPDRKLAFTLVPEEPGTSS